MSAGTVAALLADLIEPAERVPGAPTSANVANAANAANRQQACGLQADSLPCETPRIAANPRGTARMAGTHSPEFAAVRNLENGPKSEQERGLSQDSQHSQAREQAGAARPEAQRLRFLDRRARLLRWGWPEPDAARLAERLSQRDRQPDERVSCADCRHARPGRCANHQRAGLSGPALGRDLVALLQRCPGYQAVAAEACANDKQDDQCDAAPAPHAGPSPNA